MKRLERLCSGSWDSRYLSANLRRKSVGLHTEERPLFHTWSLAWDRVLLATINYLSSCHCAVVGLGTELSHSCIALKAKATSCTPNFTEHLPHVTLRLVSRLTTSDGDPSCQRGLRVNLGCTDTNQQCSGRNPCYRPPPPVQWCCRPGIRPWDLLFDIDTHFAKH